MADFLSRFLFPGAAVFLAVAACTPRPTPYQPLGESGGFEETRLQENVFRVSFKANRYTSETVVLDYLFLRSAELTRQEGYSHFVIAQDWGKTQTSGRPRSRVGVGLGFASGRPSSFWGFGAGIPVGSPDYGGTISYHLGVFVIRMLKGPAAEQEKEALEAEFMLRSIREKRLDGPVAGSG